MIEAMAQKMAGSIKASVPDHPASEKVLKFAISAILNGVFIVSLSMIISIFTGATLAALVVLISFAILRQMSGGVHLKSGMYCVLVSTMGITLVSLVTYFNIPSQVIIVVNIVNIVLALIFAPSGIEKQTRIPTKYFPLLKISTTIVVGLNLFIGSQLLAATFLVQCLTLIRNPVRGRRVKENG